MDPAPTILDKNNIGSNYMGEKSQKLTSLAQQLRVYKPPHSLTNHRQQDEISNTVRTTSSQELDPAAVSARPSNRAAVLVCIFEGDEGDLRVFLTERSSTLSSHSGRKKDLFFTAGEVALPGGKRDEGDADDAKTALREAKEEIGLDPSFVDVVAVLEPVVNKRGMEVVPVVGILYNKQAFTPVLNAHEVESIFDVPLEMFLKDENRREEEREWMGEEYLLQYFDHDSGSKRYVIWALTAGIMITVASLVYQRPPAFSERRPPFWNRNAAKRKDIPKL